LFSFLYLSPLPHPYFFRGGAPSLDPLSRFLDLDLLFILLRAGAYRSFGAWRVPESLASFATCGGVIFLNPAGFFPPSSCRFISPSSGALSDVFYLAFPQPGALSSLSARFYLRLLPLSGFRVSH